jgi:hypothetical protein
LKPPDRFSNPSTYWQLHKGLYGLRQAGRQWYYTLHNAHTALGFKRCYTCSTSSGFSMSATSVDDIIVASDTKKKSESDNAAREINNKYTTTGAVFTSKVTIICNYFLRMFTTATAKKLSCKYKMILTFYGF